MTESENYVNELQGIIEKMNAISLHQCNRNYDGSPREWAMHPLTCGKNSSHRNLFPWFDGKQIKLLCPDCDYTQDATHVFAPTTSR